MADQNKTQDTPIKLTLTIPVDGSGVVNLVGSKGDVSKIWQIAYGDQNDLAAAIHSAAWDLVNLEMAPPPRYDPPVMPGKGSKQAEAKPQAAPAPTPAPEPPDDIHAAGDRAEAEAVDEALEASLAQEDESPDEFSDDPGIEEEAEIEG